MLREKYTKVVESVKEFYNSENTQNFINSSKAFLYKILEKPVVKQIVYAGVAGAVIGAMLPIVSVVLCATVGATIGAYKFISK